MTTSSIMPNKKTQTTIYSPTNINPMRTENREKLREYLLTTLRNEGNMTTIRLVNKRSISPTKIKAEEMIINNYQKPF